MRRSREPLVWALFSGGGTMAALFLPAAVLVLWVAAPLGWVETATYDTFAKLAQHSVGRLFFLLLIVLSLFHWAHRFRYTLYDGLQLYHLNALIAVLTYGTAVVLSLAAVLILLLL
ncbi:MAG: fumarate reductase subunit FrdD [Gemmatimonadota bacterium]